MKMNKYFIIFLASFLILPVITSATMQTNCTDNSTSLLMKYRIPVYNITNANVFIPINYATCNVTIFKKQLNVDNVINSSTMINNGDGTYDCRISYEFPDTLYATYYRCELPSNITVQDFGRFEIKIIGMPLALPLGLIGLLIIFATYAISFRLKKNYLLASFFFLLTLVLSINGLGILLHIVKERASIESANLQSILGTALIIYTPLTYIITFIFFIMILIKIIMQIKEAVTPRLLE